MQQINQRQQKIVNYITEKKSASNSELLSFLGNEVSRFTVLRDLDLLQQKGLIRREGKGRAVRYLPVFESEINAFFDPDLYFKKGPDEREAKTFFDAEVIDSLPQLLSEKERKDLESYNQKHLEKIKKADKEFLKKETERLAIELSWKSSRIEGNTYSLIDTEILIKERVEAKGRKKEEALMILNHKNAIDYILDNRKEFRELDLFQIEKVHQILVKGLKVRMGIRTGPARIVGTRYMPANGKTKIIKALYATMDKINSLEDPFSKSMALILMISYIQPFDDGNKRTARMLGNAMLVANNACPLSYRSVDEADYKKAMVLFYEQNSARFFQELFIEQFKFAVDNYF